ncbi:MAG: hypothetical protein JSR50_06720 [Proteobacteria bacterium]|nr:hypothetical protein [Pseudomonadota bacterium]
MNPYSDPTKRVAPEMNPRSVILSNSTYFVSGIAVYLLVEASVLILSRPSPLLPILWFLAGAFSPLVAFILVRRCVIWSLAFYLLGMIACALISQELLFGRILLFGFKAAAFLLPALAGALAFLMIMLARRNA